MYEHFYQSTNLKPSNLSELVRPGRIRNRNCSLQLICDASYLPAASLLFSSSLQMDQKLQPLHTWSTVNQGKVLACFSSAADLKGAGRKEPVILKRDLLPLLVLNIAAPLVTDTSHFTSNAFS